MAKRLEFVAEREPWNVYVLENGVKVRARIILTSVQDSGQRAADTGLPIYQLGFQQFVDVEFEEAIENGAVERKPGVADA
jgi:hypothetical protein